MSSIFRFFPYLVETIVFGGDRYVISEYFAHVRQRSKRSVKNFAVPYPADCRAGRALGVRQLYLADKRGMDFDFLSAELPPALLCLHM